MRAIRPALILSSALLAVSPCASVSAEPQSRPAGLAVWDTGSPSAAALTSGALEKQAGWNRISRGQTPAAFKGDAVLTNGLLWAVIRKSDSAVELYGSGREGQVSRARLRLVAADGSSAARLHRVALVENTRGALRVEATYRTAKGASLTAKFRIKRGDVAVQAEPGAGTARLHVACPSRFVVLPDFFADDIMVDAGSIPLPSIELPSENFLINLSGRGDAMLMCVFENRDQDVRVGLSGDGEARLFTHSDIEFGKSGKIWAALLSRPGLWYAKNVATSESKKVVPLKWSMPFPAAWRANFTTTRKVTDSWDVLLAKEKGGGFVKPAWFGAPQQSVNSNRKRFTEVLGFFPYPCWFDREGQAHIQPLDVKTRTQFIPQHTFRGPVVFYPFNRIEGTPADAYTVVDIVRNCLGQGPCEYILDLENQKQDYKGRATCTIQRVLLDIYKKKRQKAMRGEIEKALGDAVTFVKHIRGRIENYVEFGKKMERYIAEQKKANPALKEPLAELEALAGEVEARMEYRKDRIKKPEDVDRMNEEFRKNVLNYDGPDVLKRCEDYAKALTRIGGNQDKLVSECRWVVRTLRQRAGFLMALHPELAPIAGEIRKRSQTVLRNPSMHERARN